MQEENKDLLEENMLPELLTLSDEEGVEHVFELIDTLDLDDHTYTALIPYFEQEDDLLESDSELLILKVVKEDEEDFLAIIEDEEEFNKISKIFMEKLSDLYEIKE